MYKITLSEFAMLRVTTHREEEDTHFVCVCVCVCLRARACVCFFLYSKTSGIHCLEEADISRGLCVSVNMNRWAITISGLSVDCQGVIPPVVVFRVEQAWLLAAVPLHTTAARFESGRRYIDPVYSIPPPAFPHLSYMPVPLSHPLFSRPSFL